MIESLGHRVIEPLIHLAMERSANLRLAIGDFEVSSLFHLLV